MTVRPDLVACWLFRDGPAGPEILLLHRAPDRPYPGLWQCVTGRLEAGERITEGALREVAEETGIGSADLDGFFETDIINAFHEAALDGIVVEAVFAARVRAGATIRLSHEHDDQRWLDADAAHLLVVWPAYHRAIDQVVTLANDAALAAHYRLTDPA